MSVKSFQIRWILCSGVGMSLGFLAFLNFLFFLAFGLNFDNWWSEQATEGIEDAERLLKIGLAVGLPLAGAIFTSVQTVALRGLEIRLWRWIVAGPIGFLVPLSIIWPITSIWGDIPGPVEPLTIVGGGLVGAAAAQWIFAVRGDRRGGFKWLALWSLGLVLGMLAYVGSYSLSAKILGGYPGSWATEVGVIGFLAGGLAAAMSGPTIFRALSTARS